jgi:hypothetical protein
MPTEQRHGRLKPLWSALRPTSSVYTWSENPLATTTLTSRRNCTVVKRGEGVARRCNSRAHFALGYHGGVRRNETGVLLGAALLAARRQQQKQ